MTKLNQKIAIITGAAGGIGYASASRAVVGEETSTRAMGDAVAAKVC